jgi:hypothetical protein
MKMVSIYEDKLAQAGYLHQSKNDEEEDDEFVDGEFDNMLAETGE